MAIFQEKRRLPYPRGELFELVADVEHYPEFLPGWQRAQVIDGNVNHKHVRQTLGLGPVQAEFHSHADFSFPDTIHIRANDGPFRQLDIDWHFLAVDDRNTEVSLQISVELKPTLFGKYIESWFSKSTSLILTAFTKRARAMQSRVAHPQP